MTGRHGAPRGVTRRLWALTDRHRRWVLLLGAGLAAVLYLYRLPQAPDFDSDEMFYSLAGQHIGLHGSVSWDNTPILVHPPIYFLSVGAWLAATGALHSGVLQAIHTARYLDGLFDILIVVLVGLCGYSWSAKETPADRGRTAAVAMALTSFDGFLLRFGRAVLIEPMGVALGLAALLVAWRLRHASNVVYICVFGSCIGLSVLTKEPLIFLTGGPFVSSLLSRGRSAILRNLGALAVGGFLWCSFPLWAFFSGTWHSFFLQQTVSIRRLLGLLQLTGLNRKGVSASSAFTDTIVQYVGGYLVFGVGAAALTFGLWRVLRKSTLADDEGALALLGLGTLSYMFLLYSVFIGQSNEQLSVYTVPASVLLAAGFRRFTGESWLRFLSPLAALTCLVALALGVLSWTLYFGKTTDDATAAVETYISAHVPRCAAVNATGDTFRWSATLRSNPIVGFGSGPQALGAGVHVFLLSSKDTEFQYGASNPALSAWITSHGRQLFLAKSHTYDNISVWLVGNDAPTNSNFPSCVEALPGIATDASVPLFLTLLVAALSLVGISGLGLKRWSRQLDAG